MVSRVESAPVPATTGTRPAAAATVPFAPALYDTFAVITRRAARLSPAARELIADLEAHTQAVAAALDRIERRG